MAQATEGQPSAASVGREPTAAVDLALVSLMAIGLLALAAGAAVALFGQWAEVLGAHIPAIDATGDYAAALAWALVLALTIPFWPVVEQDKMHLLLLWIVKVFVVLLPMLVYEARYEVLDAYTYFAVAQDAFQWSWFDLTEGTENIYRLVWLHGWVAPDSYHATKASFAMIGLVAVYVFYRGAVLYLGRSSRTLLYALALFPSILFWSSILGKEPLALLGIALYAYGVLSSWRRGRWSLLPLLLGLVILGYLRIWMVAILLFALVPLILSRRWGRARRLVALSAIAGIGTLAAAEVADMFMLFGENLPAAISRVSQAWAEGGSGQLLDARFASFADLARFAPLGMFTALFRPLPGEVPHLFGLLAGLENAALLGLVALALLRFRAADLGNPVVWWAIVLVGAWAAVYGFVSYQNLGTAVRFKVQILPILLCVLLYLANRRRIVLVGWARAGAGTAGARSC